MRPSCSRFQVDRQTAARPLPALGLAPGLALTLAFLPALCGLLAGCGGTAPAAPAAGTVPSPDPRSFPTSGLAPAAAVRPGGAFVVALTDSVRPQLAPVPRNRAERLVFVQLYETLVRVDAEGVVSPGLAVQWSCGADSTIWVFTLREDARLWDGQPVTARDVWRSWERNRNAPVDDGAAPWNWFDPVTGSVTVLDAHRLAVRLPEPQRQFPLLLAHPATAVAVHRPGWVWPVGSGPCRLTQADGAPRPTLVCQPHREHPRAPLWDTLSFRVTPGLKAAELLTANGANGDAPAPDLLWTRDLAAVDAAGDLPAWRAQPLPWNRVHLLICPPALDAAQADRWRAAAARLDPEHDVTAVSARPWPWLTVPAAGGQRCPQLNGPVAADRGDLGDALAATLAAAPTAVVYPHDDPAARELALRLAALAGGDARAVPLTPAAAAAALRRGEVCASVAPVPQSYADGCLQLAALLGRAAWLQHAALAGGPDIEATLAAARVATPLAATRAWLLTRDGLGGIALTYDACPDLAGLGRLAGAKGP